jgi:hypothetical protein
VKRWIPTFSGTEARRALVRQWGLPNSCPRQGESPLGARCRLLFVDDANDGAPVAYWIPERRQD